MSVRNGLKEAASLAKKRAGDAAGSGFPIAGDRSLQQRPMAAMPACDPVAPMGRSFRGAARSPVRGTGAGLPAHARLAEPPISSRATARLMHALRLGSLASYTHMLLPDHLTNHIPPENNTIP